MNPMCCIYWAQKKIKIHRYKCIHIIQVDTFRWQSLNAIRFYIRTWLLIKSRFCRIQNELNWFVVISTLRYIYNIRPKTVRCPKWNRYVPYLHNIYSHRQWSIAHTYRYMFDCLKYQSYMMNRMSRWI